MKRKPTDYIYELDINGLKGRMLAMPSVRNQRRRILFIYGQHASLERFWGLAQVLGDYGDVTVPDLPGFGGMDSFYRVGEKPTLDNLADYLATFIKLRYKKQPLTIFGLAFGFAVVTRMLQRYPALAKQVELLISIDGFARYDDLGLSAARRSWLRFGARLFSFRIPALIFRNLALHPHILRLFYHKFAESRQKLKGLTAKESRAAEDFEIYLWRSNDIRTHMLTTNELLRLDNCGKTINLPVWHIAAKSVSHFDDQVIEQHLRVIFSDFHKAAAKPDGQALSVIASKRDASGLLPASIRKLLR